jgi:glutamate synthase (NADPH/NADH) large chain/glutamate synthase (ferredoxin)
MRQVFIARGIFTDEEFERRLYVIRKCAERAVRESAIEGRDYFYISSLSSSTIVFKGLLLPHQIPQYYQDLTDSSLTSALALVHARFSTNTFPTWPLAHPYRYICHNGEINTLKGNVNWMRARQGRLNTELFGEDMKKLFPIVYENQATAARTNEANSGCARRGDDVNSGWNWQPTNQGWAFGPSWGSSMISHSSVPNARPDTTKPLSSSRPSSLLLTS